MRKIWLRIYSLKKSKCFMPSVRKRHIFWDICIPSWLWEIKYGLDSDSHLALLFVTNHLLLVHMNTLELFKCLWWSLKHLLRMFTFGLQKIISAERKAKVSLVIFSVLAEVLVVNELLVEMQRKAKRPPCAQASTLFCNVHWLCVN